MRVLITGHRGYIGSVLTPLFRRAGHEVVGLDTDLFAAADFGPGPERVPSLAVDVRDVTREQLEGFHAVVHLAALSNDPLGDLDPELTYAINRHASARLARLARDAGVSRFLYSSSCSIYGAAGADDELDEEAPLRPVTPYAISKVQVEQDLAGLADADFSPVYLRNATVYGVSPRLRTDLVLNNLVGWALLTGRVRVLSDGTPWRPICHVEDIARAFLAALEAPREVVSGQALNIGRASENYRVREIAEFAGEAVPGCTIEIGSESGPDPRSYRVDFSKVGRVLPAFRPQWTARKGAVELAEAYTRHGLTSAGFTSRYQRLPQLQSLRTAGGVDETLRRTHGPGAPASSEEAVDALH